MSRPTNVIRILVNALLEARFPEAPQHLKIIVGSRCIWLHVVELHHNASVNLNPPSIEFTHLRKLAQHELLQAAILIQISLQRRAVRLVVAVRATNASVWFAVDRPGCQRPVDHCSVGREEEGEIRAHAEDLLAGGGELADRRYAVVGEVAAAIC